MRQAGIREARQNLSVLLERVREGQEVLITDRGRPVARLLAPLPLSIRPFPGRRAVRRGMPQLDPLVSESLAAGSRVPIPKRLSAPSSGPLYLDSTALAKLYLPEPGSEAVERVLRGRRDLTVSDLAATELIAALALRARGRSPRTAVSPLQSALLEDLESGVFRHVESSPRMHRTAERLAISLGGQEPARSTLVLHLALAVTASATTIVTFDSRLADASVRVGLVAFP
jgi:antitoxin (DNA-binding transcriptional repressor) of toxin-antitoxin stability system/predicted nucleic acid-binding protein